MTWKSQLQKHVPQSSPVNGVEHFSKIDEDHVQWHISFNAFLLELVQVEYHVCCTSSTPEPELCLGQEAFTIRQELVE